MDKDAVQTTAFCAFAGAILLYGCLVVAEIVHSSSCKSAGFDYGIVNAQRGWVCVDVPDGDVLYKKLPKKTEVVPRKNWRTGK